MAFPVNIKLLSGETVSLQYNPEKDTFPLQNLYDQFSQYLENSNTNYLDEHIYKITYIQNIFPKEKQEVIFPSKITCFIPFKLFQIQNDDIKGDGDVEDMFGVYFENSLDASIYFESTSLSTDEYIYIKNIKDFYYKVSYTINIEMWHWYADKDIKDDYTTNYPILDDSVNKYKYNSISFTVEILYTNNTDIPSLSSYLSEKFFPCNRIKHVHISRKGYDIYDIYDIYEHAFDDKCGDKQGPVTSLKEAFYEELTMSEKLKNVKEETLNILADSLVEYEIKRTKIINRILNN